MTRVFGDRLPIDEILGDVDASLRARNNLVLVAPPGAGKTTRVPLALLDAPWRGDKKIILLEPRRLAARAAAARMAATLGEAVGETIGLRMRLESKISARTRVEVVTEGVFARMILDDPELSGVACVLFDEFHERSLDADLGLALALDAQGALREDLRLLVMSATLDGARVAALMGDAPVIESAGRAFPVETRYLGRDRQSSRRGGGRPRRAAGAGRGRGLHPRLSAGAGRNHPRRRAAGRARPSRQCRSRAALRRAGSRRAGPRHRQDAAGPAQDRARHLDRRDLADDRRRAHRDRLRVFARPGVRAQSRADAARDHPRVSRQCRSAAGQGGARRAGRLLSPLGGGGDRRVAAFRRPRNSRRRSLRPRARSRALGRSRRLPRSPFSIRRRAPPGPRPRRSTAISARSTPTAG